MPGKGIFIANIKRNAIWYHAGPAEKERNKERKRTKDTANPREHVHCSHIGPPQSVHSETFSRLGSFPTTTGIFSITTNKEEPAFPCHQLLTLELCATWRVPEPGLGDNQRHKFVA